MNITVKYIGSEGRWYELPYTGKQSVWVPGMIEGRDSVEAAILLNTGKFENLSDDELSTLQVGAVQASAPQRYSIGLGLFGDSLTNAGFYTYNSGQVDNFERAWGWSTWVGPMSMQRIRVVKSWAVNTNGLLATGQSPYVGNPLSVQVTAALASAEWARVTRAVICIGTNDSAFTISACAAELLTQIARLGKPVTLISPPAGSGTVTTVVGDGLAAWAWKLQWRETLKRIAAESRGWIQFVDAYGLANSPTTTPDVMQAGNYLPDGIHWNNVYAYKVADAFVSAHLPSGIAGDLDIWPHSGSAASTNAASLDQGFGNSTFATASGGTGTGTIAGSFTAANVGAATHNGDSVGATAMTGGFGNMQTITITSGGNDQGITFETASFHAAGTRFLAAGDQAFGQCLVRIRSGGIYPKNVALRLQGYDGTNNHTAQLFEPSSGAPTAEAALPLTATRTFLLRTPLLTAPSAAFTSLTMRLRPLFAGAGTCQIDIGNFECRRFRAGGVYA